MFEGYYLYVSEGRGKPWHTFGDGNFHDCVGLLVKSAVGAGYTRYGLSNIDDYTQTLTIRIFQRHPKRYDVFVAGIKEPIAATSVRDLRDKLIAMNMVGVM